MEANEDSLIMLVGKVKYDEEKNLIIKMIS